MVEERLARRRTPSRWQLASFEAMGESGTASQRRAALTAAAYAGQVSGEPVARWPEARLESLPDATGHYQRVRQIMSRDPFAVHPDQWINLVTCLMDWHRLRHVPVEDDDHRLVGLVTYRSLLRHLSNGDSRSSEGAGAAGSVAVRSLMVEDVVTVTPETRILDAVRLMQELDIGCLPVVDDGRLVGLVSERDLLEVVRVLLEDRSASRAGARLQPLGSPRSPR